MERIIISQTLNAAAGTARKAYFAPPDATRRWKLLSCVELPNAALTANATDYITRSLVKGASTALNTPVTTVATALVAGTAVNATITGVGADLEITQANPLSYVVAQSGSGKAFDISVEVEFEEQRV